MSETAEIWLKLGLCLAAAAAVWRRGRMGEVAARSPGPVLGFLALLSLLAYYNFGTLHHGGFLHHHESFHYHLGSKYYPELGYDGLYVASIAAQRERQPRLQGQPYIRDLRTNRVVETASLEDHLRQVVTRFTPGRWQAFVRDHHYFVRSCSPYALAKMRMDHGFNATPAWAFVGRLLTRWLPTDGRALSGLALLDLLLCLSTFVAVFRAFGPHVGCLSLILFGLSYPGRFFWVGGAYLRQDWLAASVIGICLLKRNRPAAAGALLGYAAMVRLFPVLLLFGPAVLAIRTRIAGGDYRWFVHLVRGFTISVVVGLAAGCLAGRGAGAWSEFAGDIELHEQTMLTNNVGLANLLIYGSETWSGRLVDRSRPDPWRPWEEEMSRRRDRMRLPFMAVAAVFLLLVAGAAWRATPSEAVVLGLGAIFALTHLTCYYWLLLLAVPLRRHATFATVAILLLYAALYGVHLLHPAFELSFGVFSWGLGLFFLGWTAPAAAGLRHGGDLYAHGVRAQE